MNKIKLVSLALKNFKGMKDLNINFGDNTDISGGNGSGKTTVFDGFMWLLFDKDSKDRKDFEIKTLDNNNEVLHGLDHEVTGVLNVNGKNVTLTKTFKEKWTKKRGEAEKQFTGHETLYYIDEVPVKKGEYQDKISSIIDENLFKLISNPLYFNINLKWQDRRKTILDIIGDISPERIINFDKKLAPLAEALEEKDIDTLKKSIAARKKKLNDDIKSIPYRIDELNNSIVEHDFKELEKELIKDQEELQEIENNLLDIGKLANKNADKREELYSLKTKIQKMEYEANSNKEKPLFELKSKLQKVEYELKSEENKFNSLLEKREVYENTIKEVAKTNDELRLKWHEVNKKILQFDESKFICPTCNRPFEEHDVEAKKHEMEENFNLNKVKELNSIGDKGKKGKSTIDKLKEDIKSVEEKIDKMKLELTELGEKKEKLEYEIFNFKPADVLSSNKEYQEAKNKVMELEEILNEETSTMEEGSLIGTLKDKKKEAVAKIDDIKEKLMAKNQNITIKARIKELEDQERVLAEQIANIEGQEFLCEEFIKTKVELLESSINNKFKYVTFKLFDTQINGGLNETCEALINGVPFSNANTASQINAGLDIINALSEYYKVSSPIFIDNRESVTEKIDTQAQIINLIVTPNKEKELYIKIKGGK